MTRVVWKSNRRVSKGARFIGCWILGDAAKIRFFRHRTGRICAPCVFLCTCTPSCPCLARRAVCGAPSLQRWRTMRSLNGCRARIRRPTTPCDSGCRNRKRTYEQNGRDASLACRSLYGIMGAIHIVGRIYSIWPLLSEFGAVRTVDPFEVGGKKGGWRAYYVFWEVRFFLTAFRLVRVCVGVVR